MSAKILMPVFRFYRAPETLACCRSLDVPKGYSYNGLALADSGPPIAPYPS